jgi:hypothetical protein
MYIRWQSRLLDRSQFGSYTEDDVHWRAVLVESERVKGKPRQRHIAYIAGFTESAIKIAAQRCHIWDRVTVCLDRLGKKITAESRAKIEAAIAEKVPRPTPAQYKDIARSAAETLGWKFITRQQRAALRDEAEQWQGHEGSLTTTLRSLPLPNRPRRSR